MAAMTTLLAQALCRAGYEIRLPEHWELSLSRRPRLRWAPWENEAASASPALGIMSQLQLGPLPGHLAHHENLMHPLKGQQRCEPVRKQSHK